MQSIDSVETYAHVVNKELAWEKEKMKLIHVIKQYKE